MIKCSICGKDIKWNEVSVGTGDGTGNSFAHYNCYDGLDKIDELCDIDTISYKPKDDFTVNTNNDETVIVTKERYNELLRKEQNFDEVIKIAGSLCTRLLKLTDL